MQNLVDIPATLQVDASHFSPPATSRPARLIFPKSIDELRALRNGDTVILIGHHKGSRRGGGIYVYDADNTLDNNATHIGKWVLMPDQAVTPYHFGAVDDWDVDSGQALNDWLAFCATPEAKVYKLEARGSFGTTQKILAHKVRTKIDFDIWIKGLCALDDVFHAYECKRGTHWTGKISIRVSGSQNLYNRAGVNGVRIDDCSRAIMDVKFYGDNGTGWALYCTGHNNMARIGDVENVDMGACGRSGRTHLVKVEGFSGDVSHGNVHQWSEIKLTADSVIPSDAHQMERAWWISASGKPYLIRGVNREAHSLKVYPYVPDFDQVMDGSQLLYGGGALCYNGGHTAKARIGHVQSMRSGTGTWQRAPI